MIPVCCQSLYQSTPVLSIRWQTEIEGLLEYLEKKTKGTQLKKFPKKSTEPQEFDLTKPKPRPLPVPELIPQQEKPKLVSINHCNLLELSNAQDEITSALLINIPQGHLKGWAKRHVIFSNCRSSTNVTVLFAR